jgi:hypothetical protein
MVELDDRGERAGPKHYNGEIVGHVFGVARVPAVPLPLLSQVQV